jgi:hypothetical protein
MEQLHAAVFSTVTTFGTAQDVALQEMRIESFFPADEVTRAALREPDNRKALALKAEPSGWQVVLS